ncbi:MAG: ABC-2 transporter permease [Lachnospiraceae bacterium]|nr:ABC-2 transporter permease [Lachnospiraceae bacterium]
MINLVLKDFSYTKKWCLISVVYCILVPIVIYLDGESKVYFMDFLIPLFAISMPLGKILMTEDTENCREYLIMLPYTWMQRVLGRYLFVVTFIVTTEVYVWLVKLIFFKSVEFSLNEIITEVLVVFAYYSSQLYLYYWKGYYVSRYSYLIWVFAGFILMFAVRNKDMDISWILEANVYLKLFLLVAVVLLFLLLTFRLKRQKRYILQ